MLDRAKDWYYTASGNGLSKIQDISAQLGYLPDRETAYVTQMGKTPLSIRINKYAGDALSTILPGLASKPGANTLESLQNYFKHINTQAHGSNRVLTRTHTHPIALKVGNKSINASNRYNSPSPQDFINAASVYVLPQNSNLKYNSNKIYTKEYGKHVKYTYDIPEHIKEKIRGKNGNAELIKYNISQKLQYIPEIIKAKASGDIASILGKGNADELANKYLSENIYNKYKRMGYPIKREEW